LKEITPVEDFTGKNWLLELSDPYFAKPQHSPEECIKKGISYTVSLKATAKLKNLQTEKIAESEVFMGDIPQMTNEGTFIISGIERCVVSQIVRSPGVYFSGDIDQISGRMLYKAELRPLRGSWLEFEVARNDVIAVRIDRRRKYPASLFLRALGIESDDEIMSLFKDVNNNTEHDYIMATLSRDSTRNRSEALIELYKKIRPGEPAILENAVNLLDNLFFNPRRYDLGKVGRYKLNRRLKLEFPNNEENWVLTREDVVSTIKYLIGLQNKVGFVDDIDHLGNRRVRRVGELVANIAFRNGLLKLERHIKEKMSLVSTEEVASPTMLVNARPIISSINEFFRSNQLSTILDQTNPLSEIDNLRRLSVMGTGGITRERASFSIRDINSSQYGRIDPVRSPEGPNIGLVTYLALYARVNEYGFLEAPYRKVEKETLPDGTTTVRVSSEIVYLAADDEMEVHITHAGINIDENGVITQSWVPMRFKGQFIEGPVEMVDYIDVIPRQVVGASASLIPFLANDEANRALMGSNMQCQAVPLLKPSSPVVGTGMEGVVSNAMNRAISARHSGTIIEVDANEIKMRLDEKPVNEDLNSSLIKVAGNVESYKITKFKRTAQSTCYNQHALVKVGQKIKAGDVIIDGPACEDGELALGQNVVVAYTSFEGLGYEDALVISDRLVKEDLLSSIHVEEYEAAVVDTKLGPEELTADIPNVSDAERAHLDDRGIVVVGSEVGPNDILVGKIAPKGETELSPEERLLRAIFGEKAREVRDTSLRMPHGERGTVIDIQVLDHEKGDELEPGTRIKVIVRVAQLRKVTVGDKLAGRHGNKGVISKIVPASDMPYMPDGTPVDLIISPLSVLARMNLGQLMEAHLGLAALRLGTKVAVPVFENFSEDRFFDSLKDAGLPVSGKIQLTDGRTGEKFDQETTVGIGYIMKLSHMVEDKTHARSTGPYSLVTQQPLGGKAQMGGQRLGEMEVWALEAHRAAHILQEMLTIKSDDVVGRAKAFEAIVKGTDIPASTVPESFKVLVSELKSLMLDVVPMGVIEKAEVDLREELPVSQEAKDLAEVSGSTIEAIPEDFGDSSPMEIKEAAETAS
jgi:DNA-directed RNA polymerase subunit beta